MVSEKEIFIKKLKDRTRRFAVDVILFFESFNNNKASSVISYQIIKSATSTGANYRAASSSRSKKEFFSKICIVVEEADETEYWLEIIRETNLSNNNSELSRLIKEANEISKIMTKAKNTSYSYK